MVGRSPITISVCGVSSTYISRSGCQATTRLRSSPPPPAPAAPGAIGMYGIIGIPVPRIALPAPPDDDVVSGSITGARGRLCDRPAGTDADVVNGIGAATSPEPKPPP